MTTQKNKIPAVYLNDETHHAMKEWAEISGITMPKLAQNLLEEMQPVLVEMITAFNKIKEGENQVTVLQNMVANGLTLAAERLRQEDSDNVTNSGKSD